MQGSEVKRNLFLKNISSILIVLIYSFNMLIMSSNRFFAFFSGLNVGPIFILIFILIIGTFSIRVPKQYPLYIVMVAYYILSVIINHGGLISALQQAYIIIFVMAMYNCNFTRASLRIVTAANLFVWIMWVINGRQYGSVYLSTLKGMSFNSNTVSELLLFSYMVVTIFSKVSSNKSHVVYLFHGKEIKHPYFILRVLFFAVTLWGIWQTESRTSAVVFIIFNVLYLLSPKRLNRKGVLIITAIILASGLIFPVFYLSLQTNYKVINWVKAVTGKNLFTGREYTWNFLFQHLIGNRKAIIFGIGLRPAIQLADFLTNVHNSYLAYLMFFGVIGLILYFIFVMFLVNDICDGLETSNREFFLSCIFATWVVLIILYTETIAVWPVFMIIPYFIMCIGGNRSLQKADAFAEPSKIWKMEELQ